jgi:plasmid stability protein
MKKLPNDQITVDLDDEVIGALRKQAKAARHSLQEQARQILNDAILGNRTGRAIGNKRRRGPTASA